MERTGTMKRGFSPVMLVAALMAACAALPPPEDVPADRVPVPAGESLPLPEDRTADAATGTGPDTAALPMAFRDLPPEARSYLRTLAAAFVTQNRTFLLTQGEPQFEREIRPRYDEETYLALLYRIGPLSVDSPGAEGGLPKLSPQTIRRLEYETWEEEGPLLEIRGRIISAGGPPLPCRIMLIWRLREPKILGLFP